MMAHLKDPLDTLFVKGDEVNRELLSTVLVKYVRLDEKGRIFPLTPFYSLSNKNKLIVILLSRKAIYLKTGSEEAISPTDLEKLTNIPAGSINPTLRILVDEKIADDENSLYKIFPQAIRRCAELLESKNDMRNTIEKNARTKISMREAIENIARQGGLDEGKMANEIYRMVAQRRPGTAYAALYKVVLDLVASKKLARDMKGNRWIYRREIK